MLSDDVGDESRYDIGSVMVPVGASSSFIMDPGVVEKAWCISKVEREQWGLVANGRRDIRDI